MEDLTEEDSDALEMASNAKANGSSDIRPRSKRSNDLKSKAHERSKEKMIENENTGNSAKGVRGFTIYMKDDSGISSCDEEKAQELQKAEKFLQSLPDICYNVVKIFSWGGKKDRGLRLTSTGLENLRGNQVTSMHTYNGVLSVTMRNTEVFVIKYDGDHDYVYKSPIAMQIVQEISCRLAVRRTNEKKKLNYDIALRYQEKLGVSDEQVEEVKVNTHKPEDHLEPTKRASKLNVLLGTTEYQRMEAAIDNIILGSTAEGKTITEFCKNFNVLLKNPLTLAPNVRQFLDGMKDYILQNRKEELSKLIVASNNPLDSDLSRTITEKGLEKAILIPLYSRIFNCVAMQTKEADEIIKQKLKFLKGKPQKNFGINPENESTTDWSNALFELNNLERCQIPADKIACLLETARVIYSTVNFNRLRRGDSPGYLSADEFLPIFIYVVVHCDIQNMETTSEILWSLSDPEQLNGEGGYYLTTFSSALHYIKTVLDTENMNSMGPEVN